MGTVFNQSAIRELLILYQDDGKPVGNNALPGNHDRRLPPW